MMNIIKEMIEKKEYDFYALRSDDFEYSVGDICNNSHELFQDAMYDENDELVYPEGEGEYEGYYDAGELDGTCGVATDETNLEKSLKTVTEYFGDHLYLIAGNCVTSGNDVGEIIISNAVVIAKLK